MVGIDNAAIQFSTKGQMYLACFIHLPQTPSKPPDVKSWTTFFTNKFEKSQKNKPYKVFSRFRTDLSLVGLNCFLYMILS